MVSYSIGYYHFNLVSEIEEDMAYLQALGLALCWGTVFLSTKNIVTVLPPVWCTFYIIFAGLLFFSILYTCQRKSLRINLRHLWQPYLIGFLLMLFPFAARSWGQQFVAPSLGGLINGTTPMWSFVAAAILLKGIDRFTWRRAAGVLVGMVGLLTIVWPSLTLGNDPHVLYGCSALVLMTWSYALANVAIKKIMVDGNNTTIEANTFHQYLFTAVVLLLIALIFEPIPSLSVFSTKVIMSILCAGVFSSAIAFLLMLALIKRWGATRMASVNYFVPVVAMLGDFIFLQRIPAGNELLGLGFIFLSLWLIQKPVPTK